MKLYYILILAAFSAQALFAQPSKSLLTDNPLKNHLDSAIQKGAATYMSNPGTIGLMIGVYKDGHKYIYSYGESEKGSDRLPGADQIFNLGSVAKTFVGTMLAEAVIEKKAKLTDDIRLYLPGKYPNLQYHGHPVRLVDIANHTSGMPDVMRQFPPRVLDSLKKLSLAAQFHFYSQYAEDNVLTDLHHYKIDTIPGTKYRYNGNAMMVLILLLERIYHQPYETLVTNYLQRHLNMFDTRTVIPVKQLGRFLPGYNDSGKYIKWFDLKHNPGKDINTTLFYAPGPSMNSTMNDMLKYLDAQVNATDPAVKLSQALTFGANPKDFAIGLNWMYDLENGVPDYYHTGHTAIGFNTLCEFYPTEHLGFMIVVNEIANQDKVSQIENDIHKALK